MSLLELRDLAVRHGDTALVDVADISVKSGQALTIVGESGSGKSLLAHAVMGTITTGLAVEGTMSLDGVHYDLADRANRKHHWGRELALLPQEPALALDPTMRVRDQVAEGAPGFRSRRKAALRRAEDTLGRLNLGHAARAWPHTLSGGMAQRVAYAAATIGGARVLIVDEPTKGLDRDSLDQLADLLTEHVATGGLLITITHDLHLARKLGGELLVMRDAIIVERGPADRVLTTPEHDYTRRLVAAEPSRWQYEWLASPLADATADPAAEPLVAAEKLAKSYGDTELFRDISLEIRPGERWALAGPSGVGKTTLGNLLLRLGAPDEGTVRHHNAVAGGRLQKLYQDPALSFPARVRLTDAMRDIVRRHGVPPGRVESLMATLGLPESLLHRLPGQVSGGELQRLAIVRAMLLEPALVFADEATSRLDLLTQERTMDCLMSELTRTGCALLLVTHDRELATAVADHHLRLDQAVHPVAVP
ncbi:ABC transporter ATP-binding protein [Haloechinothrix halophila]|uniref:ABC transporter ATP-binding protein n=1 Tax=Haloechinothrix halophila TaxID=1069073 RepID=UPI0003FAB677|nr:ATP-binding cassette domain-containing protein [Haloechinothrix halophila]